MKRRSVHCQTRKRRNRRSVRLRFLAPACGLIVAVATTWAAAAGASTLEFFEGSVAPGSVRSVPSPASDVLLDVDYGPSSAEGGGFYGLSEVEVVVTGDLVFTSTDFACLATDCLHFPLPFAGGRQILVTAGDDLNGEFSGSADLLNVSVSGTVGHVAVVRGAYIDATGASQNLGAIRTVECEIIATVPEPSTPLAIAAGGLLLSLLSGRRPSARRSV